MSTQLPQDYEGTQPPQSYPEPDYPGKTMGLVAMILSIANAVAIPTSLFGLIFGYIALKKSKEAGYPNTFAKVGIIVGWIFVGLSVLSALFFAFVVIFGIGLVSNAVDTSECVIRVDAHTTSLYEDDCATSYPSPGPGVR